MIPDFFGAVYLDGIRSPGICRLLGRVRRRPHRSQTKELNRQRRVLRKLLVLDSGEARESESCRWLWGSCTSTERSLLDLANGRRVSVPRSLRPYLGRWVGGRP